jgi:hypothetical protein
MPKRYTPENLDAIFAEMESSSDRAAILVCSALVEYALEQAIRSRLREPTTATEEAALCQDNGIFGTFSEKIWGAYFLKIVGPLTKQVCDLVRSIRNEAAHNMNPVSFDMPQVKSRCEALSINEEKGALPAESRSRFIAVTQMLSANLLMRSGDATAEIAEAFKGMAPYLDR